MQHDECKHGLTVGTCAYCSGLVKTPTANRKDGGCGPGYGAFSVVGDNESGGNFLKRIYAIRGGHEVTLGK